MRTMHARTHRPDRAFEMADLPIVRKAGQVRDDVADAVTLRSRQARRGVRRGVIAAEAGVDRAAYAIKRRPFLSVAAAFFSGAIATVAGMFMIRRRPSRHW
jgi:hypothetical protein